MVSQANPANVDIVAAHYAASGRGDVAAMMERVAPAARWTEMAGFPCAGTWIGPAQVTQNVFEVLGREWDGYHVELEALFDAGERVIAIGWYAGRYKGTGKSMRVRLAHLWTVRDGQIVAFEQFTDTLLVARAMRHDPAG